MEAGYDSLAAAYTRERERFDNWREVKAFSTQLPENARVLNVGSGTGVPVARFLVQGGIEVVGLDISKAMVSTAQKNVPTATFHEMNMMAIDLPPESFDGLISCYAIFHAPRERHADIFRSFYSVIKLGGIMLVSVASSEWEEFADYLGVDIFWSHFEPSETRNLITEAGFDVEFGRDVESGGKKHHWVLARKALD